MRSTPTCTSFGLQHHNVLLTDSCARGGTLMPIEDPPLEFTSDQRAIDRMMCDNRGGRETKRALP